MASSFVNVTFDISSGFTRNSMAGRTRPIEKLAEATAKCTVEGAVYGKCVAANYQNVSKDMCVKEFMVLKNCYLKAAGRKA